MLTSLQQYYSYVNDKTDNTTFMYNAYQMKRKQKVSHKWFIIGFLGIMLAAPNATLIKYTTNSIEPALFNLIRFGLLVAVTLPFLIYHHNKINKRNFRSAALVGVFLTLAVNSFVLGIKYSQASYASILSLLSPIFFMFYSVRMTGEKISRHAIAGIATTAVGALVLVALPVALNQQGELQFYPLATLLIMISVFSYPLVIIYSKKANQAGLPLVGTVAISGTIVFLTSALIVIANPPEAELVLTNKLIFTLAYSGIVVALIARSLAVASYERIGSAAISGISYVEKLVAIMIPVIFLGEELSPEMILGGALILFGVYLVEYNTPRMFKHFHFYRHH